MSTSGVEKILEVISSSRRLKDVAAVLVPQHFAFSLVDELYPIETPPRALDEMETDEFVRRYHLREIERTRYRRYVTEGGYVGTILGQPMIIAKDVVLCALSADEVCDLADRFGFDANEVLERKVAYGTGGG